MDKEQIDEDLTNPYVCENPENYRKRISIYTDPYTASKDCHAIVVCTEWDEFVVSVKRIVIKLNNVRVGVPVF